MPKILPQIESINMLEQVVVSLKKTGKKFIFRGQSKDMPLMPQAARCNPITATNEIKIFEDFKKRMTCYLGNREEIAWPNNDFEWFVLAQHYGLITRCLDWTYFHGVALFFAVNKDIDSDGVIWIYELPPNESVEWLPLAHRDVVEKQPFEFLGIKIYHPKSFLDFRTDKQGAVVTICPYPWRPLEEVVDGNRLIKIFVSKDFKRVIRTVLSEQHNLTEESLFSKENIIEEIENICRGINSQYAQKSDAVLVI
ncbi:MAG: FRG domain-containing protein [Candidatus Omnitrophota bacterium]